MDESLFNFTVRNPACEARDSPPWAMGGLVPNFGNGRVLENLWDRLEVFLFKIYHLFWLFLAKRSR